STTERRSRPRSDDPGSDPSAPPRNGSHSMTGQTATPSVAEAPAAGAPDGIPRRGPDATELPLSFAQEQLWFIDQYHCLPTYNVSCLVRCTGELDAAK